MNEELFGIPDEKKNIKSCVTVGYGIIGRNTDMYAPEYSKIHSIMEIFSEQASLDYKKDVKALTVGN